MVQKQIHIRQRFKTRPIVLYTETVDLTEADFENVKKIHQLVTDEVEVRFVNALNVAMERYCETGKVPSPDEVSSQVGSQMEIR